MNITRSSAFGRRKKVCNSKCKTTQDQSGREREKRFLELIGLAGVCDEVYECNQGPTEERPTLFNLLVLVLMVIIVLVSDGGSGGGGGIASPCPCPREGLV